MSDTPYKMLINGKLLSGSEQFDVINPATEGLVAHAPNCTRSELDTVIAAAREALPQWRQTDLKTRSGMLTALAGKIIKHADQLSRLLTAEQGKPPADAAADILGGAFWLAETAKFNIPEHVTEDSIERRAVTKYEPIGVVAGIVPWNFPIILAMFKVAPALLAGNTMVLKSAPTTTLTTLRIGELAAEIFPAGVLNVISGDDRLGPWLTRHVGIDKISFTGSTEVGRRVMEGASVSLKRITLELGGNDAAIVMPDVDVEAVAKNLFWAAFKNAGQICIASKRMYIHEDVYEPLKTAIVEYAKTVKVGDGAEQGTQIGPVQNEKQYERVLDLISDAKDKGYKFLLGGDTIDSPGYFIPVTLLDNPPEESRIVQEEQFGPVLPLLKFSDLNDVITRANKSEYGLGASVWSNDIARAEGIADKLQAGTIWINESQHLSPYASFGGVKQSGIGVEGGQDGLLEFMQAKTIFTRKTPKVLKG